MARTHRRLNHTKYYRTPHHMTSERSLNGILNDIWEDEELKEYLPFLAKLNRVRKRLVSLPKAWDDIPIAALSEKPKIDINCLGKDT